MLLAISAAISCAFVQPASFDQVRTYLLGEWQLNKRMTYKAGGLSGKFDGVAKFDAVDSSASSAALLAYNESGTFAPSESGFPARETVNRLLYDFANDEEISIYFAPALARRGWCRGAAVFRRVLVPTPDGGDGTLVIDGESADGQHVYTGRIEIEAPHAFIYSWRVSGPTQEGEIISLYKRTSALLAED